ncbi:MAG TPA: SPOR domain-containing protein [Bryobacteraceae bacterium]|nr:SPOR domain-containing protein [Bryobacteraceae bacterium]
MARSEEGEFELVLGNKQLISVFLVVVILLGVFFSMGYIVGRSSSPAVPTEAARTGGGKAIVVERPAPSNPAPDASTPPAETKPADTKAAETTHPEQPPPAPVKDTKPPAIAPAAAPPKPAPAPTSGEPPAGDYWQVVATTRPDAEIITQALSKKGFHAVIAPVPNDTRVRVLVGPLANAAAQAQTRADLEASGFKNPIMRKY